MWSFLTTNTDRQSLVIEAITMTGSAGQFIHVEAHLGASIIAVCLVIATLDIINNSLKRNIDIAHTTKFILIVEMEFLTIRSIENQVLILF